MQDFVNCPICNIKLKIASKKKLKRINLINKTGIYTEKICVTNFNHSFQSFSENSKIDLVKFSLETDYSKFLEIDFVNKKSRIVCLKQNKPFFINIPNILYPDFPKLAELKEKINLIILLS